MHEITCDIYMYPYPFYQKDSVGSNFIAFLLIQRQRGKKIRWFEHETIENKKCDEHVFRNTNYKYVAMTKKNTMTTKRKTKTPCMELIREA